MKSKTIAVVTPNINLFKLWVEERGQKIHKYIHVASVRGMRFKHFSEVQRGYHWEDCKQGTFEAALRRAEISVVNFRQRC